MNDAHAFLLERMPDEPANVDLRGILLAREVDIVPDRSDASGGAVRVVREASDVDLSGLPAGLRAEMEAALERTFVAMTLVDDRPVAFSYPHHETESYWDVSVDTLEAHRRRGHAGRAFGAAYEQLLAAGKQPVWGALQSNVASNQLALRLGFEPFLTRHLLIAAGPT